MRQSRDTVISAIQAPLFQLCGSQVCLDDSSMFEEQTTSPEHDYDTRDEEPRAWC